MKELLQSIAHHMSWCKDTYDYSLYKEEDLEDELFNTAIDSIRTNWDEHKFNYGLPEELKVDELDSIKIDDINLEEVF